MTYRGVTDPAVAQRLPELAVLSALAHPELTVVTAARAAIAGLPEDQVRLYWDVITAALPPSLRELLESHMQGYVYQSEFARKYYAEGQEVGLRRAAHKLLQEKLPTFTAEDQATLEALHDQDALLDLVGSLGGATNADEARAALAAVRARG